MKNGNWFRIVCVLAAMGFGGVMIAGCSKEEPKNAVPNAEKVEADATAAAEKAEADLKAAQEKAEADAKAAEKKSEIAP